MGRPGKIGAAVPAGAGIVPGTPARAPGLELHEGATCPPLPPDIAEFNVPSPLDAHAPSSVTNPSVPKSLCITILIRAERTHEATGAAARTGYGINERSRAAALTGHERADP